MCESIAESLANHVSVTERDFARDDVTESQTTDFNIVLKYSDIEPENNQIEKLTDVIPIINTQIINRPPQRIMKVTRSPLLTAPRNKRKLSEKLCGTPNGAINFKHEPLAMKSAFVTERANISPKQIIKKALNLGKLAHYEFGSESFTKSPNRSFEIAMKDKYKKQLSARRKEPTIYTPRPVILDNIYSKLAPIVSFDAKISHNNFMPSSERIRRLKQKSLHSVSSEKFSQKNKRSKDKIDIEDQLVSRSRKRLNFYSHYI